MGRVGRPVGLGLVLLSLAATMVLGLVAKEPCASANWSDGRQYRLLCYSDVVPLLGTEQLVAGNRLPYLDRCNPQPDANCDEYPVLTMYFMRGAAWISGAGPHGQSYERFFYVNAALLSVAAFVIALALYRAVGARALYFALAPTLLIYGFVNWDLLAVALATLGVLALEQGKDVKAGVMLGLGTAAKLYPVLLVVPFVAHRLKERNPDGAIRIAWAAVGSWVLVNLPFALFGRSSWWTFYRFNSARGPDWDSLWFIACRHLQSACVSTKAVNAGSFALFVALFILVWRLKVPRQPGFPRVALAFPIVVLFLLTNKVYSPQYGLWLLPLFAIALPDLWTFVAFEVADAFVFATRFRFFAELDGRPWGWPQWLFEVAVAVRAVVLVVALVRWVLREHEHVELTPVSPLPLPEEAAA